MAKLIKNIDKNIGTFSFIKEKGFTLKSLGLLVFILGLPNESVFTLDELSYQFSDGITSIRNAVSELERLGYFKRKRIRENGKINHIYIVSNFKQKKEKEVVLSEVLQDEVLDDNSKEDLTLSDKLDNLKNDEMNEYLIKIDKDIAKEKKETSSESSISALSVFEFYVKNVSSGSQTISLQYIKPLLEKGFTEDKMIDIIKNYKKNERSFLYKKADVFFQEVFLDLLTKENRSKPLKQILFNKVFKGGKSNE